MANKQVLELARMDRVQLEAATRLVGINPTGMSDDQIREALLKGKARSMPWDWAYANFAAAAAVVVAAIYIGSQLSVVFGLVGLAILLLDINREWGRATGSFKDKAKAVVREMAGEFAGVALVLIGLVFANPFALGVAAAVIAFDGAKEKSWL